MLQRLTRYTRPPRALQVAQRFLNLHEYQSKELLKEYGLNIQKGNVASTPEEALKIATDLQKDGAKELVIKCQILAGGRGKGTLSSGLKGGVKITKEPKEIASFSKQMINFNLVTHQTQGEGELVQKVLIHESVNFKKELYLAILLDRSANAPIIMCSKQGGMDIENVAEHSPQDIHYFPLPLNAQIPSSTLDQVASVLLDSPSPLLLQSLHQQIQKLYQLFLQKDCLQVEINPLVVTDEDKLCFVDAKLTFDDNASFRQENLFSQEDLSTKNPLELRASEKGMTYVALDGTVGCVVNGAGLAMATLDIINLAKATPANFLDIGGSATSAHVCEAIRIVASHEKVNVIFVNILGGIMRCDVVARGVIDALRSMEKNHVPPVVVRLEGTNAEMGQKLLAENPELPIYSVNDFQLAVEKVVELASA